MELPKTSAMVGIPAAESPGQVAEHPPARDEDLLLGGQVRTSGLHQGDHRQPVLQRDLVGAQHLLRVQGLEVPPLTVKSVCHQHALDAFHHPMPVTRLAPTWKSVP